METLFSQLRIRVAHDLKEHGFTQSSIASHLHISQAMVSKYLSQPVDPDEDLDERASEIARMISQGKSEQEILLYVCQTCFQWREGGMTCKLHCIPECTVCTRLRSPHVLDERQKVIHTVQKALSAVESAPSIVKVMPEVRMNIAMALKDASNPMEVAAVPGRLIPVHGKITAVSDPEFGASHHLASVLITTGKRAVINIKYSRKILSILTRLALSVAYTLDESADVYIDEGGFGIEPSAYVFGEDAVDAALKVQKIAELL